MRILHTSDWHLGRTLERQSRQGEQEAVMAEIVEIAQDQKCQLVLVAGDIFDTATPPAWAEALFYDTVKALADGGRRAVVVIAGNHDQPQRLTAAQALAQRMGIFILGLPQDVAQGGSQHLSCLASGPSWLELGWAGEGERAVIAALPYPSEARLGELLSLDVAEEELAAGYAKRVGELFASLVSHFRPEIVNLAMSHLYVQGGKSSDSERPIQLGSAPAVPVELLGGAQYLALGHLHRPQSLPGGGGRYCGSPLAYGFGEAAQGKSVTIVDLEPGQEAKTQTIPLAQGRTLQIWEATSIAEVRELCSQGKDQNSWIRLGLHLKEETSPGEIRQLQELSQSFVQIRLLVPLKEGAQRERRAGLPVDKLFSRFFQEKTGQEPSSELIKLFLELLEEPGEELEVVSA